MPDKYDIIFQNYKKFVEENNKYGTRVVKYNTNTSAYFPIVSCVLTNNPEDNTKTQKNGDKRERYYFTINIYAKNKTQGKTTISSQEIVDEIKNLTYLFFEGHLGMYRSSSRPTYNLDTSILRHTIMYECTINNRLNITRR